jgi:hypothetical protein
LSSVASLLGASHSLAFSINNQQSSYGLQQSLHQSLLIRTVIWSGVVVVFFVVVASLLGASHSLAFLQSSIINHQSSIQGLRL